MTACGVPQGLYQASLRDVERLKAERAATSIRCSESSDRARTDLSRCNISRSKAEAHTKVLESDLVRLKTAAGELEGDLETMGERVRRLQEEQARAEEAQRSLAEVLERFRSIADAGSLSVEVVDGRMIVKLPSGVLFSSGKARLRELAAVVLARVAQVMRSVPDREFQVEGHTDDQGIVSGGRFADNWDLSTARALTVLRFLVDKGVPSHRVSAAGYGSHRPAVENDSKAHRAQNRRIQIVLIPDLSQVPGFSAP